MLNFDGDMVYFGDLATCLHVSRASTSIRTLEERGLVKRMSKPGERQDFFQLAQNPYATMLLSIQERIQATRDEIAQTIGSLPADADAKDRLSAYAEFNASLDSSVAVALDQLNTKAAQQTELQKNAPKDQADDK